MSMYDLDAACHDERDAEITRLRDVIEAAEVKIQAIIDPWIGVRANILPPSIVALVPLRDDLSQALTHNQSGDSK